MWKHPWGYAEGLTIYGGLLLTGIVLQFAVGKIAASWLSFPLGLIAGALFLILLIVFHVAARRAKLLRWFAGPVAAITAVSALLFLVIIMGLTRQLPAYEDVAGGSFAVRMGFMQMTASWAFALLFLYLLLVLGLTMLRRISRLGWKDTGFVLNHAGLFIALFAAAFGSGDLRRLRMTAPLDTVEWRATDERNEMVELPLAVELLSFSIDEYPPKLMLMDNATGEVLPLGHPASATVEACPAMLELGDLQLEIVKYYPSAAAMITSDTVVFAEFQMEGATSAVYVKARAAGSDAVKEGWISCGSFMFPPVPLRLDGNLSLIMPDLEPRRFASEVTVYTKDGETRKALIEVNKPLAIGGWKIYQLSYDQTFGKWSRYSVFELVSDPWLPVVYTGIGMMLAGALFLFLSKPVKKE